MRGACYYFSWLYCKSHVMSTWQGTFYIVVDYAVKSDVNSQLSELLQSMSVRFKAWPLHKNGICESISQTRAERIADCKTKIYKVITSYEFLLRVFFLEWVYLPFSSGPSHSRILVEHTSLFILIIKSAFPPITL